MPDQDLTHPRAPRLLAIVPARGGSRRLPGKNVRLLDGDPLIAWTLRCAQACGLFEAVVVSTDDAEIAAVARRWGAAVPGLRSAHLATDTATTAAVLQDVLARHPEPLALDAVVLLQPTSPFRRVASVRAAVARFLSLPRAHRQAVVSVSPAPAHPAWCFSLAGTRMQPLQGWEGLSQRSQDLPPAYVLNGALYVLPPGPVLAGAPILAPGVSAWVMDDADEALDIDDAADWARALALAPHRRALEAVPAVALAAAVAELPEALPA
jgi:CMP-N,N'-diacetyllegionaminic acid synthase